ncbi:MAG: hypothetical protein WCS96_01080 [Victivallales bacterium]|jgi:hypothetical protein
MPDAEKIFALGMILTGIFFFISFAWTCKTCDKNISEKEKLPRNRLLGVILAGAGFFWCVFHSKPLLSPSMHVYLIPAAALCTWIAYLFLDFLFARAFGGMLILLAHYFLHESFAFKTPCKPFLSLLCFIMGTYGIFLCGKPHLLRDMIRHISKSQSWKYSMSGILLLYSIAFIIYGFIHLAVNSEQ